MCWAHTGDFCAHVVGSVTVVELNLVTLIEPESERALVETEGAASLSDETVEFVRDGLVVDGFNGLDVGSLPDECSAKKKNGVVGLCSNHERDWWTFLLWSTNVKES